MTNKKTENKVKNNPKNDVKIGQFISMKEDFETKEYNEKLKKEIKYHIKKSDIAIITNNKCIMYITGEAQGKIQSLNDIIDNIDNNIDNTDYDIAGISKFIYMHLKNIDKNKSETDEKFVTNTISRCLKLFL